MMHRGEKVGPVWYGNSNTCFQFLNNITRIFTYFFTHTYFHTCFQITKHMFLSACIKHPWYFIFGLFHKDVFFFFLVTFLKFIMLCYGDVNTI